MYGRNLDRRRHTTFIGSNQAGDLQWETKCRVAVAEAGVEFTFVNQGFDGAEDLVRWSFSLKPANSGTVVTELWTVLPAYESVGRQLSDDLAAFLAHMKESARAGMGMTHSRSQRSAKDDCVTPLRSMIGRLRSRWRMTYLASRCMPTMESDAAAN